jgi:hypothetical protein
MPANTKLSHKSDRIPEVGTQGSDRYCWKRFLVALTPIAKRASTTAVLSRYNLKIAYRKADHVLDQIIQLLSA